MMELLNHLSTDGASEMKSITEILGGIPIFLDLSFELQKGFEEYLTEEQRVFL